MYLQPVGDKPLNEKLIQSVDVNDENIDALIEIAVSQGAAPAYGYRLLLQHYGTCNGITSFDTQSARFDKETQRRLAHELLYHIYSELTSNIRYAIKQREDAGELDTATLDETMSLAELMDAVPDLTQGGAHHLDTTHLASVMRIARLVTEPDDLRKASELAAYGAGLDSDFQYPGSPPFEDTYVDHGFYYNALIGRDVDAAIQHFENKTVTHNADEIGPVAEETLVDLLVRIGRNDEALKVMTERLLGKHEPMGLAPQPFEIAKTSESLRGLKSFYEDQQDLLGFAVCLLDQNRSG